MATSAHGAVAQPSQAHPRGLAVSIYLSLAPEPSFLCPLSHSLSLGFMLLSHTYDPCSAFQVVLEALPMTPPFDSTCQDPHYVSTPL